MKSLSLKTESINVKGIDFYQIQGNQIRARGHAKPEEES